MLGETSDDYEGEWGNIPIAFSKLGSQLTQQITKSVNNGDTEITAVLKEIRAFLSREAS